MSVSRALQKGKFHPVSIRLAALKRIVRDNPPPETSKRVSEVYGKT